MQHRDVIIIGGGPAGRDIVHALHNLNSGYSITLIKDEEINVNRCAVPCGISENKPIEKFQIPNQLVTDFGTELVVDRAVKLTPNASRSTPARVKNTGTGIWYWRPDPVRCYRRSRAWTWPGSRRYAR